MAIAVALCVGLQKRLHKSSATIHGTKTNEIPPGPAESNRERLEKVSSGSKAVKVEPEKSPKSDDQGGPVIRFEPNTNPQVTQVSTTQPVLDPEQDLEKRAREAPTTVRFDSAPPSRGNANSPIPQPSAPEGRASVDPALETLAKAAQMYGSKQPEPRGEQNEQFAKSDTSPLPIGRKPIQSPFVVLRGTPIQAVITSNVSSQLPGQFEAMVRDNVYSALCGQPNQGCYMEVPAGSVLHGKYNANVAYAQDRMQISLDRLTFPDGSSADLGNMAAYAPDGTAGVHGRTNNHWKRIIGGALLTSGISAGISLSQSRNNAPLSYPSAGQVAGASVGQGLGEVGNQITSKNVNIPPFNMLSIGQNIIVKANRDMLFDGPYEPLQPERK